MLETNLPAKPFLGVRFVLSGFDPLHEQKVRSKLVEGGGVDAGQYSKNCSHVIVHDIVYDDPLCVTARKDCKWLVTGFWVDHSFDIGMPVDTTSIIYRPPKDLKGIPGAKGLIMCLTGYQRQDRDDIMTMVGLMGAQFSKPLVANKVTHLVCYKFEGEKYELAKKLPKIKLVNHRWLEDCLRDWKILPEDNYNKSGYEMEMMEAEAKDSYEEAEDTSIKHYVEENTHKGPFNLKSGDPEAHKSPKLVAENNGLLNVDNNKGKVSVPSIDNKPDPASSFNDVPFSKAFDNENAGGLKDTAYNGMPNPHYQTLISKNAMNEMTSSSRSAERTPHSDGKSSAASYQRKTPRRLGELSRNGFTFDKEPMGKLNSDDFSSTFFKAEHSKDRISLGIEAIQKGFDLQSRENPTGFSPQKSVQFGSFASPNLQKNNDAKTCIRKSVSPNNKILGLRTSFHDGLPETNESIAALCADVNSPLNSHCSDVVTRSSSFAKPSPGERPPSKAMVTESGQQDNGNEKTSPSPMKRPKVSSLSSVPNFGDFDIGSSELVAADMREPQKPQQVVDGSAASYRGPETNSNGPSRPILLGNENSVTKPLRKKMVAKKTLGSRPKSGSVANKKGAIYPDKKSTPTPQNDAATSLSGAANEKSAHTTKPEVCSTIANNEAPGKAEIEEDANKSEDDTVHRTESPDDETETPEEKFEQGLENVIPTIGENATPVQLSGKADILSGNRSTSVQHLLNDPSASTHSVSPKEGKGGNESGNAQDGNISTKAEPSRKGDGLKRKREKGKAGAVGNVDDNISALAERSTEGDGMKKKKQKGKTGAVGKSKTKKADDVKEVVKSKEHVEETNDNNGVHGDGIFSLIHQLMNNQNDNNGVKKMEKEKRAITCPVAKPKHHDASKKKLEKSVEDEKENKPVDHGTENRSEAKRLVENQAVKEVSSLNVEQSSAKSSLNSSRKVTGVTNKARDEPVCFILSGHRLQRKEFQKVIRRLKGRFCRDSHQWSYQATHFIAPDPIRRTEKFFAAAASGRWILKTDYLTACNEAGKFVEEEPHEWYGNGLSEDGAISMEAPRKWHLFKERTGHGAFYGMRVVIYGECITPPLDTLKRVVKAGDGTILATSPPYTRFLDSGVDFAIITPGMPRVDAWVQEFLKHEIPCVVADYLVEYVCKPGYSLEKHVLYNSHALAEKSLARLQARAEEVVMDSSPPDDSGSNDVACKVCGCRDRGEVMLICGDESGSTGCGVGCHIDCCDPPFKDIPEDDWFCSECSDRRSSKSSEKSSKKRKKGTSSLKCK